MYYWSLIRYCVFNLTIKNKNARQLPFSGDILRRHYALPMWSTEVWVMTVCVVWNLYKHGCGRASGHERRRHPTSATLGGQSPQPASHLEAPVLPSSRTHRYLDCASRTTNMARKLIAAKQLAILRDPFVRNTSVTPSLAPLISWLVCWKN